MSSQHRDYFNRLAAGWPSSAGDELSLLDQLRAFRLKPGERILDVGAGNGVVSRLLHSQGPAGVLLFPMDLSEQMLAAGKRLNPPALHHAVCADIYHAAFSSQRFDAVICYSVFPHLSRPAQAGLELLRLLKPGGRLLILHNQCSRKLNLFHAGLPAPVMKDQLLPAVQLQALLAGLGFVPLKVMENPQLYWVEVAKATV